MHTLIVLGVIALVIAVPIIGRAVYKPIVKKRRAAEKAACEARADDRNRREQADRETVNELMTAAVNGNIAAQRRLRTESWSIGVDGLRRTLTTVLSRQSQLPDKIAAWRRALASFDFNRAMSVAADYASWTREREHQHHCIPESYVRIGDLSAATMNEQTKAAFSAYTLQLSETCTASLDDFAALRAAWLVARQLRIVASMHLPPNWNALIVDRVNDPEEGDFNWKGWDLTSGEPRRLAVEAVAASDAVRAGMLLTWWNARNPTGGMTIEPELRVQLAELVHRHRATAQPTDAAEVTVDQARHE